jgi:hypothetical protein
VESVSSDRVSALIKIDIRGETPPHNTTVVDNCWTGPDPLLHNVESGRHTLFCELQISEGGSKCLCILAPYLSYISLSQRRCRDLRQTDVWDGVPAAADLYRNT